MRVRSHAAVSFTLVFACLAAVTACGKSISPTAPSSVAAASPTASAPTRSGATVSGTVIGPTPGMTVAVTGTALRAAVDAAGRFSVTGAPSGSIELHFSGEGIDARLQLDNVAEGERIDIRVTLNGNAAAIDADERVGVDDQAELRGPISNVNVAARTFSIGSVSVTVPAGVDIRNAGSSIRFEDLRDQQRVQVEGVSQGGVIVASQVQIEDDPHQPEPPQAEPAPDDGQIDFSGTVTGLSGSCPAVSFSAGGRNVRAGAATGFSGGGCGALQNNLPVEVKGTPQADGSVVASQIKIDK